MLRALLRQQALYILSVGPYYQGQVSSYFPSLLTFVEADLCLQ